MDQVLVKPSEAAKALCIGRTTVYALIKAKTLRSVRVGRSIRIPIAAVLAFSTSEVPPRADHGNVSGAAEKKTRTVKGKVARPKR